MQSTEALKSPRATKSVPQHHETKEGPSDNLPVNREISDHLDFKVSTGGFVENRSET